MVGARRDQARGERFPGLEPLSGLCVDRPTGLRRTQITRRQNKRRTRGTRRVESFLCVFCGFCVDRRLRYTAWMPATRRRAYMAWIAVCLIWGTTYLGIRIALETIPPFLMAAF